MKKVIVTGGAGFIGSNLVDRLIDGGIDVTILDDLSTGREENINPKAKFIKISLQDLDSDEYFKGVDIVFHTAALARVQPSIKNPIVFNNANVNATLKVLYYANMAGVKRVVYSASSSCYGNATTFPTPESHPINPLSPYGLQKYIGEQYCKMFSDVYGLDTCCLRYFNVYGEKMNLTGAYCLAIGIFTKQMLNKKPLTIRNDGNQRRDFTYVGDVVEANILAGNSEGRLNGDSFYIGNGNNFSVNEVADMLGGDKEYGENVLEPFETLADNSKAKKVLGWKPKGNLPNWIAKYKIEMGI